MFQVRNDSSLIFFELKRFYSRFLLLVSVKRRVFSNQELILSSIVLITLKEWLLLSNKLEYTHTKVQAKVQPYQPSALIVFPTQILIKSTYDFFKVVLFVVTKRRAPVNSITWLFPWSSSCKKAFITFYCWQWNTFFFFFVRVDITSGVNVKQFVSS